MGLTYRRAEARDWKILLDWRNDPVTRQNSFETGEVDEASHRSWFERSMSMDTRRIYILQVDQVDAGMVRADEQDGSVTLSWNVAPNMRGKGLGKRMVQLIKEAQHLPVRAEIKAQNVPSIKIAEFCGLVLLKTEGDTLIYGEK